MKSPIKALLVMAVAGMPTLAKASDIPTDCCPAGCKTIEGPVTLGATFLTAEFLNSTTGPRAIPLAQKVIYGKSPDTRYRICVRYTDFGDEEIKCVLTPMLM